MLNNNKILSPAEVLKENKLLIKKSKLFNKINIGILTNYSANFLEPYIKNSGFKFSVNINSDFPDFDQIEKNLFEKKFFKKKKQIIFISFLLDYLLEDLTYKHFSLSRRQKKNKIFFVIERIKRIIDLIQKNSNSKIVILNFPNFFLDFNKFSDQSIMPFLSSVVSELNLEMNNMVKKLTNCYIYDFSSYITKHGSKNFFDETKSRLAFIPFSIFGLNKTANIIARCSNALSSKIKKCLVVDLDDTLWGGVLGELGPDNIVLNDTYDGLKYISFQKKILSLKARGILLAISSKNNISDVKEVFKKNKNLILSLKDFSSLQINWNDKATNINKIAKDLNIGLDSIVFFDNNPLEREWVKKKLPEVSVIESSKSHHDYIEDIENSHFFDQFIISDEDKKRHKMYKEDFKRKKALKKSGSYKDFLKNLKISTEIKNVNKFTIQRCAQLVERTNQFNLTNNRYEASEILNFIKNGGVGLSIKLSDKFGDYGIVGFIMAIQKNQCWVIDEFVFSCRALGRNIEHILLKKLIQKLRSRDKQEIIGVVNRTEKNKLAHKFYLDFGFKKKGSHFVL